MEGGGRGRGARVSTERGDDTIGNDTTSLPRSAYGNGKDPGSVFHRLLEACLRGICHGDGHDELRNMGANADLNPMAVKTQDRLLWSQNRERRGGSFTISHQEIAMIRAPPFPGDPSLSRYQLAK